jgi:hypothetical protein
MGGMLLLAGVLAQARPVHAAPITVRFVEGLTHGFPVLRSLGGERLATGEMIQVARGDVVESRLVFRFDDGSLYDETVVFSQRGVFELQRYRLLQRGPSFPESIEASIDRATGDYRVRYRADEDSPEEVVAGQLSLPADVYSGMLGIMLKNVLPGESTTVQIVAFTPRPRLVEVLLAPDAEDHVLLGEQPVAATRYLIKPRLGLLASLLVTDLAPLRCWIVGGEAPAFVKFEGPLYFMGPAWRIELD